MTPSTLILVLKLLDIMATAMKMAPEVAEQFKYGRELMKKIINQKRDPTKEEWERLDALIDAKLDELNDD